ncbi:MAG: hypothetical protein J0I92_17270 [Phyllobacterium sp.]|jgi:hypothetical protein|nr:hypothetical protein [Phyllobacterium sp.]ODT22545.1 MAG: hypothetical protein ABS35_14580 [Kaistia sp. SCN 65-12]
MEISSKVHFIGYVRRFQYVLHVVRKSDAEPAMPLTVRDRAGAALCSIIERVAAKLANVDLLARYLVAIYETKPEIVYAIRTSV